MPVSRGYYKLEAALGHWAPLPSPPPAYRTSRHSVGREQTPSRLAGWRGVGGEVCADLGCSTGGFTECLLEHGVKKVYSIDTGYGVLDYKLRNDTRVVVLERTNALHVTLPEKVDLVVIDASWTRQEFVLPAAERLIVPNGTILSLVKPQYEVQALQKAGLVKPKFIKKHLSPETSREVFEKVFADIKKAYSSADWFESPIKGGEGNVEYWLLLK